MSDTRKNVKVAPSVKHELQAVLKELDVKSESLAIAYLVTMYKDQKHKRILLSDHQAYLKAASMMNNQGSF